MSGDEDEADIIDNAVLGMAWMWSDKTTVVNAEKLVVKNFQHSYTDVYNALVLLWEKTGKVGKKPSKQTKSDKLEATAKELVAFILKLKDQDEKKVKVIMTPTTLAMVPLMESTWGEGDEASTAARLLNLEKQMSEMRMELAKGVQIMTRNVQPGQVHPSQVKPGQMQPLASQVQGQTGHVQYSEMAGRPPAANTGTGKVQRGRQEPWVERQPQEVVQEGSDDGFQMVKDRRKKQPRKVQYGTGKTSLGGAGGEATPYEVWIGNTHPDSTPDIIKEVLTELGKKTEGDPVLTEDLQVLECECLTKARTDGSKPYTKQWRVKVSSRFRQHMMRPEAFQVGWSTRRYFPARPKVPELHLATGVARVEEVASDAPAVL